MQQETPPPDHRLQATNRQVLSMAVPIAFALLVPQFNFIVNSLFLSRLGSGHLGAAGVTGVYYLIFAAIGYGLNNGLQVLIARRAGQDRLHEVGRLSTQSIYVSLAIALFGILTTYFVAPFVLEAGLEEGLREQALTFLRIRIWGLPFLYLYQMRNGLLVGTNNSRLLIWGTLAETLSNVLFDYLLIFGHWGFPRLGFNGAAYASIIAEVIGMLAVFAIIARNGLTRRLSLFSDMRFRRDEARLLLVRSSPLILQFAISIVSWEFFFILVSHQGRLALDISQFMRVVIGFMGVFAWSFASTTNTMVSNLIGQGREEDVVPLVHRIVRMSMGCVTLLAMPLLWTPGSFLGLIDGNEDFVREGMPVLRVVAAAMVMMSFSTVWMNAVTGTGNTRVNLTIEAITIVVYSVYVYLVMERWRMPVAYGWMSEWVYWIMMFTMSFAYMRRGKWRKMSF